MSFKIPWDDYYMNISRELARRSNCVKRQIGALIIVATGYGVTDCCDGGCARCADRGLSSGTLLDTCICCHAEENAIVNAAYHGISTKGGRLYTTYSPCLTCAKMSINAGIMEIVYWADYPQQSAALLKSGHVRFKKLGELDWQV